MIEFKVVKKVIWGTWQFGKGGVLVNLLFKNRSFAKFKKEI
jgi:hypothetical protein